MGYEFNPGKYVVIHMILTGLELQSQANTKYNLMGEMFNFAT